MSERPVTVRLTVDVTMMLNCDPERIAEALANFIADDPDDLFPEILTMDDFHGQVISGE